MLAGLASKLTQLISGGLVDKVIDTAVKYFPPEVTPAQKQQFALECQKIELKYAQQQQRLINQADALLTQRISQLEGTAQDLLALPVIGRLLLFLRGAQRPVWGFATLYLDWCWFASWQLTDQQETALTLINVLVLGFLFGERAIKNVMPLITQVTRHARKAS